MKPKPIKGLGQHFLIDKNIAQNIVKAAQISRDEVIIELGPGLGALTTHLCSHAKKVIAIEIDQRTISFLEDLKIPNLEIRRHDMLKCSFEELAKETDGPLKIVSNLPYNISGPMMAKFFDERNWVKAAVVMVQREVGERLLSSPGNKDYGVLSVLLGYCFSLQRLFIVPPTAFNPRPKVFSTVLRMDKKIPEHPLKDASFFKRVVKTAFQKRRKKIKNALKDLSGHEPLDNVFNDTEISPEIRPECLSVQEFVRLANRIHSKD